MLIDAHMHTSGISPCSRRTPAQIIAQCLADKTDGFVLTNHCDKGYPRTWVIRHGAADTTKSSSGQSSWETDTASGYSSALRSTLPR